MSEPIDPNELDPLLNLPVYKILKDDWKYNSIFERRVERLQAMCLGTNQITEAATKALALTREAHVLAESIRLGSEHDLKEKTSAATVENVLAWHSSLLADNPQITTPRTEELREKAYSFFRWFASPEGQHYSGSTIREALTHHLGQLDELDVQMLAIMVKMLLNAFTQRQDFSAMAQAFSRLIHIYRGLLYVGIMDTTGSELERKELAEALRSVAQDLVGKIPGIDWLLSIPTLAGIVNKFDLDKPLVWVEHAHEVANYLAKYCEALQQWKAAAGLLNKSLYASESATA